jgi:hypothetical protein
LLALVHAKRHGSVKRKSLILANKVVTSSVGTFHGALLDSVNRAKGRDNLASTKNTNLKFTVSKSRYTFRNKLTTTINGV